MATLKLVPRLIVAVCSCGERYTPAEWQHLARVGLQESMGDSPLELRNCTCGSTLAVPLDPAPVNDVAERLRARIASLEHDLKGAGAYREHLERVNTGLRRDLWRERNKDRLAANQTPAPHGTLTVVSTDPADPGVRVGKVGGSR